jgi:hypothetical protein
MINTTADAELPPHPAGSAWTDTNRSRRRARVESAARHPLLTLRRLVRRQRGVERTTEVPVSADDILARLCDLPLSVWTYGFDHHSVRHLGPMAQDFAAAFGLGDDDTRIDAVDATGVLMACVQALRRRVVELQNHLDELQRSDSACPEEVPGGGRLYKDLPK